MFLTKYLVLFTHFFFKPFKLSTYYIIVSQKAHFSRNKTAMKLRNANMKLILDYNVQMKNKMNIIKNNKSSTE